LAQRLPKPGPSGATKSILSVNCTDADGEQQETPHWIGTAFDCGYISESQGRDLMENCLKVGRMLGEMRSKSELFCGDLLTVLRDSAAEYFTGSDN